MTRTTAFCLLFLPLLLPGCPGEGGELPVDDDDSTVATDDDDATEPITPTSPVPVGLTTADGKELRATFQAAPGVTTGPAVLLLHELYGSRQDFNLIWDVFLEQGIAVLAFDFRGHGASGAADQSIADLRQAPGVLEQDVDAALAYLATQPVVDAGSVGLLGLDVGANLALVFLDQGQVAAAVAITPDVVGVEALSSLSAADLTLSAVQYVAGETNAPDTVDATALYDLSTDPRDLRIVLGTGAHGADMLSGSSDARTGIVLFLRDRLTE